MKYKLEKFGLSMCVAVLIMLVFSAVTDDSCASAFQSPLVTPTVQPDPEPVPDPGDDDGTLEFPDVDFDITILAVIAGLVQMSKQFGVSGKGSLATSVSLGLLLGGGNQLATTGTPSDFAGWFGVLIVGLAYGLSTSGLYLLSKTYRPGTVS